MLKLAVKRFFLIVGQAGIQGFKFLIDGRPFFGRSRVDRPGVERFEIVGYHSGKTPAGRGKFDAFIFGPV